MQPACICAVQLGWYMCTAAVGHDTVWFEPQFPGVGLAIIASSSNPFDASNVH